MFDEEPDGDPHGECALEIRRQEAEIQRLMEALKACVETMEIQEGREQQRFHISHTAFIPMWTDALAKARAALEAK